MIDYTEHIGLVIFCIKRVLNHHWLSAEDYEDLKAVGIEQLWICAGKFDDTREVKFSAFAVPRIFGMLHNYYWRVQRQAGFSGVKRGKEGDLTLKVSEYEENIYGKDNNNQGLCSKSNTFEFMDLLKKAGCSCLQKEIIKKSIFYGWTYSQISRQKGFSRQHIQRNFNDGIGRMRVYMERENIQVRDLI